ncbi:hypothetical protein K1719_038969 [Acacia pycnantha]|nr:hypothetical protein K1719_038969 [Acacia pycnantha]
MKKSSSTTIIASKTSRPPPSPRLRPFGRRLRFWRPAPPPGFYCLLPPPISALGSRHLLIFSRSVRIVAPPPISAKVDRFITEGWQNQFAECYVMILRGNSQSRGIVIVAVSRSPSSYISFLKTKGVDIESSQKWIHILDCYTDPLGWKDKIRKSRNVKDIPHQSSHITSSYKAMKDLEKLFSIITELGGGLVKEKKARFCVAIDSLSELLRHTTSQSVSGFLSNLRSHDQISCIFGLLHSDLHDDRVPAALDYMSSMVANVEPFHHSFNGQRGNSENCLSEQSFSRGKFNVRFKRRNGRVRVISEEFKVDPEGISFTSVSSVDGASSVSGLLPKLQFNLQLSEKERTDRAKVVLPFEHQGNDDEMPDSDEDPDDDLDI